MLKINGAQTLTVLVKFCFRMRVHNASQNVRAVACNQRLRVCPWIFDFLGVQVFYGFFTFISFCCTSWCFFYFFLAFLLFFCLNLLDIAVPQKFIAKTRRQLQPTTIHQQSDARHVSTLIHAFRASYNCFNPGTLYPPKLISACRQYCSCWEPTVFCDHFVPFFSRTQPLVKYNNNIESATNTSERNMPYPRANTSAINRAPYKYGHKKT